MSNETTLDDVLALSERIRIERDRFAHMTGSPEARTVKYSREMSWASATEYLKALDAMVALIEHGDELRAALEDARRWRHARKLLTVDDIEGMHGAWESFGRLTSEEECVRADAAIDAALAKIDAALEQEPQE